MIHRLVLVLASLICYILDTDINIATENE